MMISDTKYLTFESIYCMFTAIHADKHSPLLLTVRHCWCFLID